MEKPFKLPLHLRILRWVLRVFFYLLYQPLAWTYDLVAWVVSNGKWKSWVLSALPYLNGPRILELGHGPGHLQAALHKRSRLSVFGLDRSIQMSRQAHRRLRRQGHTPALVNGNGMTLPFPAAAFQQIVATFPTEYIARPETLAEIWRVLSPGGWFIVIPSAWITGKSLPDRAMALLFRVTGQSPRWDDRYLEPLVQAGEEAGFQSELEWLEFPNSRVLVVKALKPLV